MHACWCRELYRLMVTIYGRYEIRFSAGGSGCLTGCVQVRLFVCLCLCVQVCVLSGRFRVPYWMSTGVCVRACMRAEWEVQGSVLNVYRCVRMCMYVY